MYQLESPITYGYINKTSDTYKIIYTLIIKTINSNPKMSYNDELQLTYRSIIHNKIYIIKLGYLHNKIKTLILINVRRLLFRSCSLE